MCLEDVSEAQTVSPVTNSVILGGAAINQMLKPAAVKNFAKYASQIFIPYIFSQFQNASCVDVHGGYVLKQYLKGTTREKCGKEVHRHIAAAACIPGNWQDFLHVNSNKTNLYKFLSHVLLDLFNQEEKQLVINDGEAVLTKPPIHELGSLSHEEADSSMLLHVSHSA